jgi:polyhydroxyalkanoate synthesis regulator phasin
MVVEIKPEGKQDMVDKIIKYESGNMTNEETIKFFQELIDSGMAWKLQGHYGRTATHLLEEGLCTE